MHDGSNLCPREVSSYSLITWCMIKQANDLTCADVSSEDRMNKECVDENDEMYVR